MLYYFYKFLDINIFQYISVRAGIAFFIAFILTMFLMPRYIKWAKSKKANQPINKWVKAHENKKFTPTMGGAVFIIATLVASVLTVNLQNLYILGGLLTLIGFSAIGLKDDLGKILTGDNLQGLSSRGKLALQALVAVAVSALLIFATNMPTTFYLPFIKTPIFDMGYWALALWVLVFLAASNAVNLTDGLDGLATVPTIIVYQH